VQHLALQLFRVFLIVVQDENAHVVAHITKHPFASCSIYSCHASSEDAGAPTRARLPKNAVPATIDGMHCTCAIDFGTSNSVVAVAHEGGLGVEVIASEPSCILITDDGASQKLYVGDDAIANYRGSADGTRFVKSMKSLLSDPGFESTRVFGRTYTAAHLVRPVLRHLKERAEARTGQEITRVVLGRPVHFSARWENDALAEKRLREAAVLAGFTDITFQLEPIAAGWSFASRLRDERMVLVADLGGGTADFCLIRFLPDKRHEVLAVGGARIGGDDFDGRIMWNRLVALFGHGSRFESWGRMLDVPVHVFVALCRWDRIPFLKESRTWSDLLYILQGSTDTPAIRRLLSLIRNDLGFPLYRAIAAAKHELSRAASAAIVMDRDEVTIAETLTRPDFESMIHADIEQMSVTASETIASAGLAPEDVDVCFMTGGCSLVPAVAARFRALLPGERLSTEGDAFTSVVAGLALYGLRA
jgi:hypothetical chaperone protein